MKIQTMPASQLLHAITINYDVLRDPSEPTDTKLRARRWIRLIQVELNARGVFGPKLLEPRRCGCGAIHTHAGLGAAWLDPEDPVDGFSGYHWDCKCGTSLFAPLKTVEVA